MSTLPAMLSFLLLAFFSQLQPQAQQKLPPPLLPSPASQTAARATLSQNGAGTFRISGIVVDSGTGQPMSGAEVRAVKSGPQAAPLANLSTVGTGPDGRFVFEGLEPGRYTVSVRKRGYPPTNYQQHENLFTAVIVGPDLDSENLAFSMHVSAIISGQVTDESSEPVRGAQVMLYKQNLAEGKSAIQFINQRQTDDQGSYRFSGLQSGTYYVGVAARPWYAQNLSRPNLRQRVVQRSGASDVMVITDPNPAAAAPPNPLDVVYPMMFYRGALDPAGASPLNLLPGEQAQADFSLYPVASVHLRLKLPPGTEAGQGLNVSATEVALGNHQVPVQSLITAPIGDTLEVAGLPPGPLLLNIAQIQNGREGARWEQSVDASRDLEIRVGDRTAAARVSGAVKTSGKAPLPKQGSIQIRNRETGQAFGAGISADGEFEIRGQGIRPGTYDVTLTNYPGFHIDHLTAIGAKASAHTFEYSSGESVHLTVEVAAGLGRIEGVVLREGKPASGVMVLLVPADAPIVPAFVNRNQSDSDGSFNWIAVRPGKYTVVAIDNGWNLEWAKPGVLTPLLAGGEPLEVLPDGLHKITVKVQ